ncbi:shikimate dehydrogenase family protein [Allosphingosinicella humi]
MIYAEVIGDPVAQSKSPAIHKTWLAACGLEGDYRATQVRPEGLAAYVDTRRADPDWRGCNVTIPHKQAIIPLLDTIDPGARAIGAVNCVHRIGDALEGRNSDIDGIAAALDGIPLEGRKVALIGAGGAARAALAYLVRRKTGSITLLVRDPQKAESLREMASTIAIFPLSEADEALSGARLIINASPMGMDGSAAMPPALLDAVTAHSADAALFDMVYKPLETAFLATGRAHGGTGIDGLTMLIGQARAAFALFFGHPAPTGDVALRDLLAT